jgi:hypothetical protein
MTWRCLNNVFVLCQDQDKWNKEAEEQRAMNPDPNIIIVLRCELDPETCGKILINKISDVIKLSDKVTWTTKDGKKTTTSESNKKKKQRKNTEDKIEYNQQRMF